MSDTKPVSTAANSENTVERTAKTYSNIKTIAVAVISAIGVIFAAGIYYNELRHKLDEYVDKIAAIEKKQSIAEREIADLKIELSAEKKDIRASINKEFLRLPKIENISQTYKNDEPRNNGGGNSATVPPGRCQVGEIVVGVQPYKTGDGLRSIIMQCGKVPLLQVD
jgi:hypothetical protein